MRKYYVLACLALLLAGCSFVVSVDGDAHEVDIYVPTRIPTATATDAPTDVPTATATSTPEVTPTASVEPSPTPEILPTPTITLTPAPVTCAIKIGGSNINLRAAPAITGAWIKTLQRATVQTISQWYQGDTYLWAYNGEGWFATYVPSSAIWWVYGIEGETEVCVDVPGWPYGLVPPSPIVAITFHYVGFKVTPGAQTDVLVNFHQTVPSVAFVVQDAPLSVALRGAGVYTVFVPWSIWPGDCPDRTIDPVASARWRLEYVDERVTGAAFDAVVITNECAWPTAEYYAAWATETIKGCDARGWTCIPHVWNSGTPEIEWLPALDQLHCLMETHGHFYGANIYPVEELSLMSRAGITPYTTWRHEKIMPLMECSPAWAITELAPDYGGWPPDVADTAEFILATRDTFNLIGVWYYAGDVGLPIGPIANWSRANIQALAESLG